jgi:hypothetical protein
MSPTLKWHVTQYPPAIGAVCVSVTKLVIIMKSNPSTHISPQLPDYDHYDVREALSSIKHDRGGEDEFFLPGWSD